MAYLGKQTFYNDKTHTIIKWDENYKNIIWKWKIKVKKDLEN